MRRRYYLATIVATILVLVLARITPAVSRELPKGHQVLSLSLAQAVALALKNNRTLQTSRRTINTAASVYRAAKGGYYPTLKGEFSGKQDFSNLLVDDRIDYLQTANAGFNITASMPLDLSGAVSRAVQQALIGFITGKINYAVAAQALVAQVYQEYYEILRAQETVKIDQGQVDQTAEQLRIAEERLKSGRVPGVDVMTAKVQYDNARQTLKIDQGALEIAKSRLRNTLVIKQEVDIIPTERVTFEAEKISFKQAFEEAMKNRLEIKAARLSMESARIALRSTYDPYLPTMSLTANYGYNMSGTSPHDAWNNRPKTFTGAIGANFSIPIFIFDGGIIRENKYQAMVNIEQTTANLKQTEETVSLEIKDNLTQLDNSAERVETGKASINLAQQTLRIMEMRYRTGVTSYLEVTDSRNNLRTAELNYLNALISYNTTKINVYRVLGRPLINAETLALSLPSLEDIKTYINNN